MSNQKDKKQILTTKFEFLYTENDWIRLRDTYKAICAIQKVQDDYSNKIELAVTESLDFRKHALQIQNMQICLRIIQNKLQLVRKRLRYAQMRLSAFIEYENNELKAREILINNVSITTKQVKTSCSANKKLTSTLICLQNELLLRRRYLIYGLCSIFFPEKEVRSILPKKCYCVVFDVIRGLHLPQIKAKLGHSDDEIAAAFGTIVILLNCIGKILDVPLKHCCYFMGSKSFIQCRYNNETFPLYNNNSRKHRDRFDTAMLMINNNVNQLRTDVGILTFEGDRPIKNLNNFLYICIGKQEGKFIWPQVNVLTLLSAIVHLPNEEQNGKESTEFNLQKIEFVEKMTKVLTINNKD